MDVSTALGLKATRTLNTADLREIAFRDLERSIATIKQGAEHLSVENPIVLRMIGSIAVAEASLKIISVIPSDGAIRALPGPRHGQPDEADFDAGGAITVDGAEKDAEDTNESDEKDEAAGDGAADVTTVGPPPHAIAHAQKKLRCGAHDLGCTHKKTNGNSNGRHQQCCPFFQTAKLLEAGYSIDTFEDYAKALKKENRGKIPGSYKTIESLKKNIDQEHGSYRKVLLSVRAGVREREKSTSRSKTRARGKKKAG